MAEKSFPLENTVYTAEDASLWFATRTSGVHASDQLGVTASDGLTVNVGVGVAWLKYADFAGVSYANTEVKMLQLATANANYPRIDRVVIRYSKSESRVYLAVKSGTAASSPAAPDVTRNSDTYEISLAQIRVDANAASISASNITDERLNNTVCGLMTDGVTPFVTEDSESEVGGLYRVGDIYITTNSTSPAELFGGSWEQIKDRFLLAAGDTYTAGSTGGEAMHTLTEREMPTHWHSVAGSNKDSSAPYHGGYINAATVNTGTNAWYAATSTSGWSEPHNNMPPYLTVYMWRRVA